MMPVFFSFHILPKKIDAKVLIFFFQSSSKNVLYKSKTQQKEENSRHYFGHEFNSFTCGKFLPFSAWCPLKGHTNLNKPAAESRSYVTEYLPWSSPSNMNWNKFWVFSSNVSLIFAKAISLFIYIRVTLFIEKAAATTRY